MMIIQIIGSILNPRLHYEKRSAELGIFLSKPYYYILVSSPHHGTWVETAGVRQGS